MQHRLRSICNFAPNSNAAKDWCEGSNPLYEAGDGQTQRNYKMQATSGGWDGQGTDPRLKWNQSSNPDGNAGLNDWRV
jgi:hypothetical protein